MRINTVIQLLLVGASLASAQNLTTSTTGSCGGTTGETCLGSRWGDCCSGNGFCGQNQTYCGAGCQSGLGACYPNANLISVDGSCGINGTICPGSIFGNCCSKTGFCGSTSSYCGTGCQSAYGACGDAGSSSVSAIIATSLINPSSTTSPSSATSHASATSSVTATTTPISASSASSSSTNAATGAATVTALPQATTATAGFKAGIAIMAVAVAVIIAALVWFFAVRRRPNRKAQIQSHNTSEIAGNAVNYHEKEAYSSASQSELGGGPVSELPGDYRRNSKHVYVDQKAVAGHDGAYRGN